MNKTILKCRPVQNRRPRKVKITRIDRGRGGDPVRLAALLGEVMGK